MRDGLECPPDNIFLRPAVSQYRISSVSRASISQVIIPERRGQGGYRRLSLSSGEPHVQRPDCILGANTSTDTASSLPTREWLSTQEGLPVQVSLPVQRILSTQEGSLIPVVAFAHITDMHVTDAQSPARAEYLSRLQYPASRLVPIFKLIEAYRPQEPFTTHVLEAMCRAIREISGGPATGLPLSFTVSTGDAVEISQRNELGCYVSLLDGEKRITPNSGDPQRWEGVGKKGQSEKAYWHPDGTPAGYEPDIALSRFGFPVVPGILEAALQPFTSTGLGLPWYATIGNHDKLVGGFSPGTTMTSRIATGGYKFSLKSPPWQRISKDPERTINYPTEWISAHRNATSLHTPCISDLSSDNYPSNNPSSDNPSSDRSFSNNPSSDNYPSDRSFSNNPPSDNPPHSANHLPAAGSVTVSADANTKTGKASSRSSSTAEENARMWYAFDSGNFRCLVLDTVNPWGGLEGSLDGDQLAWLESELKNGSSHWRRDDGTWIGTGVNDKLFILFSHHPFETLINGYIPTKYRRRGIEGKRRVLAYELLSLLSRTRNVILWLNGHTHIHKVSFISALDPEDSAHGIWQMTTSSLIDWPQQSRIIEIAVDKSNNHLLVFSTVLDHAAPVDPRSGDLDDPLTLASWSRELAANHWIHRNDGFEPVGHGSYLDRNVMIRIPLNQLSVHLR